MAITYTSRTGKTYYLHTGPKRGGGIQYYFSSKATGTLAEHLPKGFEVYESVNGQVYLRRQQPKLIRDSEVDCVRRRIASPRGVHRYKIEVRGNVLTVHESSSDFGFLREFAAPFALPRTDDLAERFAHYQPVLRFALVDADQRLFASERYCFRGSVDDWISIGLPGKLEKLAGQFLKHLGQESFYELF